MVDFAAGRQHGDDDLGVRALGEIIGDGRTVFARVTLRLLAGAIPDDELVLFGEVTRHGEAHRAEADECDLHGSRLYRQETGRDPPASVAEREVASAIGPRKARPFARSTVVWVRGGRVAEGSRSVTCQFSRIKKKRAVRPLLNCCCLRLAESSLISWPWEERDPAHAERFLYQSALIWV